MTTTSAGLIIKLCLVSLTVGYDIFCNDLYNCQREALGEADYRYNPMFLQQPQDSLYWPKLKRIPEEILKSRSVRWTRMRRGGEPWNRLKKDSSWLRLKKDSGWNRLKKDSGLASGWVRMTRSPRIIDKFGRIL